MTSVLERQKIQELINGPDDAKAIINAVRTAAIQAANRQINDLPSAVDSIGESAHYRKGATSRGITVHKIAEVRGGALQAFMAVMEKDRLTILNDGGDLSYVRTAASALSALEGPTNDMPEQVAIVGTGRLAKAIVHLGRLAFPGTTFQVVGKNRDHVQTLSNTDGVRGYNWADLSRIVADAKGVITATRAEAPFLDPSSLQPGAVLAAMGSDKPGKKELMSVSNAYLLTSDDPNGAIKNGEFQGQNPAGITHIGRYLEGAQILGEVQRGVIYDSTGAGFQDWAIAKYVADKISR